MTNDQIIFAVLYFGGIALAAAVCLIFVQALVVDVESRIGPVLSAMLLPLITTGIMVSVLLGNRNLKYAMLDARAMGGQVEEGGNLLRLVTVMLLAISFAKILGSLARSAMKRRVATDGEHRALFLAMVAFFICTVPLPAIFGTKPAFVHYSYYAIALFVGAYMSRHEPLPLLLRAAKYLLLAMMLGSLLIAPLKPDLVAVRDYGGSWIPGFNIRLWGLTSNANSIGPLALTLLLLEMLQPTRRRLFGMMIVLVSLVVIVLSQSKTAWASAMVATLIISAYRHGQAPGGGVRLGLVATCVLGLAALASILLFIDVGRVMDKLSFTRAGSDITTLTGRAAVWGAALETWKASPFFGYGPLAWGPEHRMQVGINFAVHAHNQFMQSLSEAGAFGAIALVIYFCLLLRASWRAASRTRGVSLGLMAFIAIRCVSEVPLDMSGAINGEMIMHLLLFILLVNEAPDLQREAPRELKHA